MSKGAHFCRESGLFRRKWVPLLFFHSSSCTKAFFNSFLILAANIRSIRQMEFVGLKKMLSLRTQTEACHCEPVRTLANPPDFQDTIIEQLPLFFCVYGRTGPVLADRKIRGIATPACALVRNDMFYFSAINTNLSYRTDTCPALVRAAGG